MHHCETQEEFAEALRADVSPALPEGSAIERVDIPDGVRLELPGPGLSAERGLAVLFMSVLVLGSLALIVGSIAVGVSLTGWTTIFGILVPVAVFSLLAFAVGAGEHLWRELSAVVFHEQLSIDNSGLTHRRGRFGFESVAFIPYDTFEDVRLDFKPNTLDALHVYSFDAGPRRIALGHSFDELVWTARQIEDHIGPRSKAGRGEEYVFDFSEEGREEVVREEREEVEEVVGGHGV
jgi:hypothetical protein